MYVIYYLDNKYCKAVLVLSYFFFFCAFLVSGTLALMYLLN